MPLQSAADEPSTTGSGRVLTGAKGAGIGHRPNQDVWELAPKELTSCHLKPAHCFYSIQMFSSTLSLLSFPPFLPLRPPLPFLTFPVCVWMARQRNNGHWWSVCSHSSLPLDFCCIYFQVPECFDISTVFHFLHSISLRGIFLQPCMWCCLRACQDQLISHSCGSCFSENKKCVWFFYILMFSLCFVDTRPFLNPLHAYTF